MIPAPSAPQVGLTPKETIWRLNKARLYRYESRRTRGVPILFSYALINRPYILDLQPGSSLVEYLTGEGYDVYVLDWGTPGEEDARLAFDDYVLGTLPRVAREVLRASGKPELTLIGYCMGGTMAGMYTALHPTGPVRNLVLLAAPCDFSRPGVMERWLAPENFDAEHVARAFHLVPADFINMGTKWLKPIQNYVSPWVRLAERGEKEDFVRTWRAMNTWVNDGVPFAGAAYRQWIHDFYQDNKLVRGELELGGRRVDLSAITCPVLNVSASEDHLVPAHQSEAWLHQIASADKTALTIRGGHVGIVASPRSSGDFFPKLAMWLEPRSEAK